MVLWFGFHMGVGLEDVYINVGIYIYMHIFPIADSRWGVLMNTSLNDLKFTRVN